MGLGKMQRRDDIEADVDFDIEESESESVSSYGLAAAEQVKDALQQSAPQFSDSVSNPDLSTAQSKESPFRTAAPATNSPTAIVRPPVLVTCPGCDTSFTVSRAAVSGLSKPNFHCSKCDLVFAVAAEELKEVAPVASQRPVPQRIEVTQQAQTVVASSAPASPVGNFSSQSAAKPSDPKQTSFSFVPMSSVSNQQNVTKPGSNALPFNGERVMVAGLGEVKLAPLSDTPPAHIFPGGHQQFVGTAEQARSARLQSAQTSGDAHRSSYSESSYQSPGWSWTSPFRSVSAVISKAAGLKSVAADDRAHGVPPTPQRVTGGLPRTVKRASPFSILVPITLMLVLLGAFTVISLQSNETRKLLSENLAPRESTSILQSLILRNVNYSVVTLENGDQFGVISGSVYNGSGVGIEGATIEGSLFSSRGDELAQVRTVLSNRLSRAKIESLTAEMIHNLQSERRGKAIVVRPGESHPFIVAIALEGPARSAASYAARVVSAK